MQKRSKNLKKPFCLGQKNVHFFYCTWNRGKNLSYLREYRKFGCCVTLSCVLLMQGPLINFNLPSVSLGGPECQCRSQGTKDLPFGSGEWQRKQSVPPSWHEKTQYINYMELFGDEIHFHVLGRDTFTSHTSYFLLRHAISWNHQVGTWWKYRALSQGMRANLRGQQNPSSMQHEEESVFFTNPQTTKKNVTFIDKTHQFPKISIPWSSQNR